MSITVNFTVKTSPNAGVSEKTFEGIDHMREWFRSVFFSETYKVRGVDRAIYDDHDQLLGYIQ